MYISRAVCFSQHDTNKSLGKRDPQLRKCLYQIACYKSMGSVLWLMIDLDGSSPLLSGGGGTVSHGEQSSE